MYTTIIAVRPQDQYIIEAVRSITAQTLPPSRILVVVNGGLLSEGNVANDVSRAFPHVEIHQIDKAGMVPAFRYALEISNTEFISFLDSDDLWMAHKAEIQIELLRQNYVIDAVFGGVENFGGADNELLSAPAPVASRMFSATTFRNRAFEKNGYPDETATHFTWLYRWWARAATTGLIACQHDDLVLRRRVSSASGWVSDYAAGSKALMAELRRQINLASVKKD